jgi:hypothetical protein
VHFGAAVVGDERLMRNTVVTIRSEERLVDNGRFMDMTREDTLLRSLFPRQGKKFVILNSDMAENQLNCYKIH